MQATSEMIDLSKYSAFQQRTAAEYIFDLHYTIEWEPMGLWEIVGVGYDTYEYSGEDLVEFIRITLRRIAAHGAVVCNPASADDKKYDYVKDKSYYSTKDWVEHVIAEWLMTKPMIGPFGPYFGMPQDVGAAL